MEIIQVRLANGMPLFVVPMSGARGIGGVFLVEAGWRYETKSLAGIAHFLEHMAFKGTEKWPTAKELSYVVEGGGGVFNAATNQEVIKYWVWMPSSAAHLAPEILADMILHPRIDPQDIEKEKGPVLEELAMYETSSEDMLDFLWVKTLFGSHPSGSTGLGTRRSVGRIQKEMLLSYMQDMFVACNSMVLFAGNIQQPNEFIDRVSALWLPGLSSSPPKRENKPFGETQTEPRVALKSWKTKQVLVKLGVKFPAPDFLTRYILSVLSAILGAGQSSRLFLRIREELGLAYAIDSQVEFESDIAYLEIHAGLNREHWQDGISAIMREFTRVANEDISEEELQKTKGFIVGNIERSFESSMGVAYALSDDWTGEKRLIGVEERIQMFMDVTPRQILEVAQMIFRNDRLNLAAVGPSYKEEEAVRSILRF